MPPRTYMSRSTPNRGDAELAFAWLEHCGEERNPDLIEVRAEPVFDRTSAGSAVCRLLRRVGWRG